MSRNLRLESKFPDGQWTKGGREYRAPCPFCPGRGKTERLDQRCFSIDVTRRIAHCFRCGYAGSLHDVFWELFGGSGYVFETPRLKPKTDLRMKLEDLGQIETAGAIEIPNYQLLYDEEGNVLKTTVPAFADRAREYLKARGFLPRKSGQMRVGISVSKRRTSGRVIFPCFGVDEEMVYYQARSINGKEPKYLNPYQNKKYAFFNYPLACQYEEVVLVEGAFDCVFANCGGILGKTLSPEQEALVCGTWDVITIMLDPDAMEEEGVKMYRRLHSLRKEVYLAWCPGKDPNSTDPLLLEDALANRKQLGTHDTLKIRLEGI